MLREMLRNAAAHAGIAPVLTLLAEVYWMLVLLWFLNFGYRSILRGTVQILRPLTLLMLHDGFDRLLRGSLTYGLGDGDLVQPGELRDDIRCYI